MLDDRKSTESTNESRTEKREWNFAWQEEILNLSVELQGEMSSEEALGEIARMARLPVDVSGMLEDIAVRLMRRARQAPRRILEDCPGPLSIWWTVPGRHAAQIPDRSGENGEYDAPLSEALSSLGLRHLPRGF